MRWTTRSSSVFGVGMTERQRRALLKQHPEVVSWSDYLEKRKRRTGTAG